MKDKIMIMLACCILVLTSCSKNYEPIDYGKEMCAHCKMTIVDDRYAAEMITQKGKVIKFDDIQCMKQFISEQKPGAKYLLYVDDYLKKNDTALNAAHAVYLKHEFFASPMNGNYAAFATEADAQYLKDSLQVDFLTWNNL